MSITKSELKNTKSLLTKKGRKDKNQFVAEGVRLLEEALRFNALPKHLYFCESQLSNRGKRLVEKFQERRVTSDSLKAQQSNSLSDAKTPQGIIGVFDIPGHDLSKLYKPGHRKILVCDSVSDPGNMGTLIRSALAFGFDLVVQVRDCAEPYSPKVVRSSAGAVFGMKIAVTGENDMVQFARSNDIKLVGADIGGGTAEEGLAEAVGRDCVALVMGAEADGLSDTLKAGCDRLIRIDHANTVESLNVAIAGSILMKQMFDLSG